MVKFDSFTVQFPILIDLHSLIISIWVRLVFIYKLSYPVPWHYKTTALAGHIGAEIDVNWPGLGGGVENNNGYRRAPTWVLFKAV